MKKGTKITIWIGCGIGAAGLVAGAVFGIVEATKSPKGSSMAKASKVDPNSMSQIYKLENNKPL